MKPTARLRSYLAAIAGSSLLAISWAQSQTIYDWKSDAPDGYWSHLGVNLPGARWFGNSTDYWDAPPTGGVLRFNNDNQLTMTNNVVGTYNIHGLIFGISNSSARTINSGTIRLFDFSGTDPYIQNDSSATHVINSALEGDGATDPLKININSSGGLTFGGTINNQGTWIDVVGSTASAATVTFNGAISGAGGIYKANANTTLVLAGSNSYSGGTNLSVGTLQLRHANALGTGTPALSMSSGTTLQLRNDVNTNFASAITAPTTGVTYNFDVNQATVAGTGKTLSLGNLTFATSNSGTITNTINVTGGNGYTLGLGTISAPSSGGSAHPVIINATTAAVEIAKFSAGSYGHALQLQGGNTITLTNFEMGSNGANTLTVSGANTVVNLGSTTQTNNRSGGTAAYTLTSGTLNLTTTTSLANVRLASGALTAPTFAINGGTLNNTSGTALTLAASPGTGTIAGSPTITIGGNFAFGTAGSTSANNLNLGTGAITNAGNRTITFAGTGTTLTMGGTMTNSSGADQTTTVNGVGNTLSLGAYNLSNNNTLRTGIFNGDGNVTITGIVANGGTGAGKLTYSGTGTLTLGGQNTYGGATTVNSGTLRISPTGEIFNWTGGSPYGADRTVTVNSGATLEVYAWQYGLQGSIGDIFFNSPFNVNGGTIKYTGVGENSGNNNGRTFTIGTGGATLDAAGSGTWFITRNGPTGTEQTIGSGLTLTMTGTGNGSYSNNLVGSGGAVTKSGAGTWTLAGANTYTGATTVSAGTLVINGNQNAATGAVSVAAGLTNATAVRLKGAGTVGGNTSFAADPDGVGAQVGGIHSPGNSVGKQTFDQAGVLVTNLTYNSGSIFEWELASTPAATVITTDLPGAYASNRGTAYDAVNVTGTLSGSGAIFRIVLDGSQNFTEVFWDTNRTWTDIFRTGDGTGTSNLSYEAIFSGGFQYYNYSGAGTTLASLSTPTAQGSFSLSGNTLTWTAIPEPTSALAGLLLTAGLLRRRRK